MHALCFDRFGDPDVLAWRELPDPRPGPGQALVRIHCAGLNLADVYRRRGTYHLAGAPPWILGYEGAGSVLEAPADSGLRPGDRVGFADAPFANATLCAVDCARLLPLPDGIGFDTAAALLLQGLTAQYLVRDSHRATAGEIAVVHAAGGGVGLLLTRMLARIGAHVVAVASSPEKRAAALAAGARVAAGRADWRAALATLSEGRGAHVVYDSVGSTLGESLDAARTGGSVVFYGMADGDPAPVDPRRLMDRSLTLTGGDLWNVLRDAPTRRQRAAELFADLRAGAIEVRIAGRYAMRDGAAAHRFLESRAAIGKVLLFTDAGD